MKFIEILISCGVAVIDLFLWKQNSTGVGLVIFIFFFLPEVKDSELQRLPTDPPIKEKISLSVK